MKARSHQRRIRETTGVEPMTAENLGAGVEVLPNGQRFGRIPIPIGRTFIEKYEWLGHAGRALIFYGMWFRSHLYGVEAFTPVPYGLYKSLGKEGPRTLQLSRGACCLKAGPHAASMLLGACLRDLRRRKYRLVVAYADKRAGELGVVYRAANAIFGGETYSNRTYYEVDGRWITDHTLFRSTGLRVSQLPPNTPRKQDKAVKLRFYWKLHKSVRLPENWQ